MGMISSLLVFQIGQARVWYAMSRDGLLLGSLRCIHVFALLIFFHVDGRIFSSVFCRPSGYWNLRRLIEYRHLFAFALVAAGVLILALREPNRPRAFRAPGGPIAPIITIVTCFLLMAGLPIMKLDSILCMDGNRTRDLLQTMGGDAAHCAPSILRRHSKNATHVRHCHSEGA